MLSGGHSLAGLAGMDMVIRVECLSTRRYLEELGSNGLSYSADDGRLQWADQVEQRLARGGCMGG